MEKQFPVHLLNSIFDVLKNKPTKLYKICFLTLVNIAFSEITKKTFLYHFRKKGNTFFFLSETFAEFLNRGQMKRENVTMCSLYTLFIWYEKIRLICKLTFHCSVKTKQTSEAVSDEDIQGVRYAHSHLNKS